MRPRTLNMSTVHRTAVAAGFVTVAAFHCLAIFALYRGRVVAHWSLSDSDLIVFYLPTLVAFAAYLLLLTGMVKGIGSRIGLAVLLTFVSAWASAVVAFNTYGT